MTFDVRPPDATTVELGAAFAAFIAECVLRDFSNAEIPNEEKGGECHDPPGLPNDVAIRFDTHVALAGTVTGADANGEFEIVAHDVDQATVQRAIEALNQKDGRRIILHPPNTAVWGEKAIRGNAERCNVKLREVRTMKDIVTALTEEASQFVYLSGVKRVCECAESALAELENLEEQNRKFMDRYTRDVVRPGTRLLCLNRRRRYYDDQLKEMRVAYENKEPVSPICDELKRLLKRNDFDFTSVSPDQPVGEEDLEEEDESDDENDPNPRRGREIPEPASESIFLTDAKRRFNQLVLIPSHDDHQGSSEKNIKARRARQDSLLMQACILREWPSYIHELRSGKEVKDEYLEKDDMSIFANSVTFFRESRLVLFFLLQRLDQRQHSDFTNERLLWQSAMAKKNGSDTIEKEKEQIVAETRKEGREIRRLLKEIRDLCVTSKT